jgi:hypothetical protein
MLVTFTCQAYADITMFGDVAVQLLKMMGQSGTVPSALLAEDVAAALEQLEAEMKKHAQETLAQDTLENVDEEPQVTLSHRALPLIDLLKASEKAKCNIMWDSNH